MHLVEQAKHMFDELDTFTTPDPDRKLNLVMALINLTSSQPQLVSKSVYFLDTAGVHCQPLLQMFGNMPDVCVYIMTVLRPDLKEAYPESFEYIKSFTIKEDPNKVVW